MPTRSDVERLQAVNRGVVALARRDLNAFWSTLDLTKPEAARDALLRFVPALVEQYGEVAASVAADWYDDLRVAAGGRSRFSAALADGVNPEAVAGTTRYGAGHLFTDAPAGMLDFLQVAVSKFVLQPGRDTVIRSASRDPMRPRWARVPSGAETCAFCLMLASRGPVYLTETSAGQMRKYHGDCDCLPTPVFARDELPEGYDPEELYAKYQEARSVAGSGSTKQILSALREEQGIN